MKEDLTKRYEDIIETTATPGWANVLEDIDIQIKARMNPHVITNERELYLIRGQLEILAQFRDMRVTAESCLSFQELGEEEANDFA